MPITTQRKAVQAFREVEKSERHEIVIEKRIRKVEHACAYKVCLEFARIFCAIRKRA